MAKFEAPKARSYLAYDSDMVSNETGLDASYCDPEQDVKMASQEFKDECDINKIIERYDKHNMPLPVSSPAEWAARCGDISGFSDYHGMLNAILDADSSFMELPAKLRARFDNDPGKFLEFVHDDKNRGEAESLGLVVKAQATPGAGSQTPGAVDGSAPKPS